MAQETRIDSPAVTPGLLSILHANTRKDHLFLNKSVTARLPLCVPPHATTPYVYAVGMTVFSHLYCALEDTWDALLQESDPKLSERQYQALSSLRIKELMRREHLEQDLSNFKLKFGPMAAADLDRLGAQAKHFRVAISESIHTQPLRILSYAYALYLGLFNGGRWISNTLANAGPEFWQEEDNDVVANSFLSFWYFDDSPRDSQHGQQIKNQFRTILNDIGEELTDDERDDIVRETQRLFTVCAEMVEWLDGRIPEVRAKADIVVGSTPQTSNPSLSPPTSPATSFMSAWQSLKTMIGYVSEPAPLRQGFEQHS